MRFYLVCYIVHRFEKINDNLIMSFKHHTNRYQTKAQEAIKENVYKKKNKNDPYLENIDKFFNLFIDETIDDKTTTFGQIKEKVFQWIDQTYFEKAVQFCNLFRLGVIDDKTIFSEIKSQIFSIISEEKIKDIVKYLKDKTIDETELRWEYYLKISNASIKMLRPLACAIDFRSDDPHHPVIAAFHFIKGKINKNESLTQVKEEDFPKEFIPEKLKLYLYTFEETKISETEKTITKKFNARKYEFLVYLKLAECLELEEIYVNNSMSFKSFQSYFISDDVWDNKKDQLIADLNNPLLTKPIEDHLNELENILEPLFVDVNEGIKSGKNKDIKMKKGSKKWTLPYKAQKKNIHDPLFDELPHVNLSKILRFVDEAYQFRDDFEHIKPYYSKSKADVNALYAVLSALGMGYGLYQMSESSDIQYFKLDSTKNNFIRLENLEKVNNKLASLIEKMPIFKYLNIMNIIWLSIDGKKFKTKHKHIMARYSQKYYGTYGRGIVSLSMIVNYVCIGSKVISAHDYEGHFLFDMIYNNETSIDPQYCSGDTHSINSINFVLLYMIGKNFTPHIKRINHKSQNIYSFKDKNFYKDYLITPYGKINRELIIEEWDNILRIFVSLCRKNITQSIIVNKLNSCSRHNRTKEALMEFNKILMSIHVLNFIHDRDFRQGIRTALNRGEGYHQLMGRLSSINGDKFQGKTELDFRLNNACMRFIGLCVMFYNMSILSKVYELNKEEIDDIKIISPLAFRHINFNGRYEFSLEENPINIMAIITNLDFKNIKKRRQRDPYKMMT